MIRSARVFEVVLVALAVLSFASCSKDEEKEDSSGQEGYDANQSTDGSAPMTTDMMEPMSTDMMSTDMMGTDMSTDSSTDGAPPLGPGAMLWNDEAGEEESESWLSWVSAQGPPPRIAQAMSSEQPGLER